MQAGTQVGSQVVRQAGTDIGRCLLQRGLMHQDGGGWSHSRSGTRTGFQITITGAIPKIQHGPLH